MKKSRCNNGIFCTGTSAGARTQTGAVGGRYGIQFHHGRIYAFIQFLFTILPSKDINSLVGWVLGWAFLLVYKLTTIYIATKIHKNTRYCVALWIRSYRRRPVLYPTELRIHFFALFKKRIYILPFFTSFLQAFMV